MARRKLENKNIRKIFKSGATSYAVTIPIEIIKELKCLPAFGGERKAKSGC